MPSSWATREDLEIRFSGEEVIKAATRSFWDDDAEAFVVDRSDLRINQVINAALEDAKSLILECLNSIYSGTEFLENYLFQGVKYYHAHLSYLILKEGSGCKECDECLEKFKEKICLKTLCSNDQSICLTKKSLISVTPKSKKVCHCKNGCGCKNVL